MFRTRSFLSKHKNCFGLVAILALLLAFSVSSFAGANQKQTLTNNCKSHITATSTNPSSNNSNGENLSNGEESVVKFAHVTDPHISIDKPKSMKHFRETVEEINSRNFNFVVITGDLVDWSEEPNWRNFQKICENINPPTFITVGNHDYRKTIFNVVWPAFPLNSWKPNKNALDYYYKNLYPDPNQLSENFNLNFNPSKKDFSFDYESIHMVILDSGHDLMTEEFGVADGSGLTDSQIDWLRQDLENEENIFIAMHHPVFNTENLETTGCITYNRKEFTNLAENRDVIAVLSGHTHKNENFLYNEVRYIQTANPSAFRIITFDNGMNTRMVGEPFEPSNSTSFTLGQVWAGVQWTHIRFLKTEGGWIGENFTLLITFGAIIVVVGFFYKVFFLKNKG